MTFIGFGEAARTFAGAPGWRGHARAFDIRTDNPGLRDDMRGEYRNHGVRGCDTLDEALEGAALVLSLVTADQAILAARSAGRSLPSGALFCDLNSVAPDTKRAASEAVIAAGGRYADVAIMSPVIPAALNAPLLISGPCAEEAEAGLRALGFVNTSRVGADIGRASAIKMIRSVMVKGVEALTAECVLAANRAGVTAEVLDSLGADWSGKANYNLDRMMVHGLRRAAEMEEVVATLEALGVSALMTRATVQRQRAIGLLGAKRGPDTLPDALPYTLPDTLDAKLHIIDPDAKGAAG